MKAIWIMLLASGLSGACVTDEEPAQGELQLAEMIEVHGCRPGTWEVGEGDNRECIYIDPGWGGGGGDHGHVPPDERVPCPGPRPGGGDTGPRTMDPEPDRNKDRNSCDDWCHWNKRQCIKECWHRYPDPVRDFNTRNRCLTACDDAKDPNHGLHECRGDCQRRFPERPITALEPSP